MKSRQKSTLRQSIVVQEWAAKHISTTIAGTVDDKGTYQKGVIKQHFPWAEFGFPEMVSEDTQDEDTDEYLTAKPPPPHREEGENPEFDYILGDGNTKGAMRDNAKIGNIDHAVAATLTR